VPHRTSQGNRKQTNVPRTADVALAPLRHRSEPVERGLQIREDLDRHALIAVFLGKTSHL
jgi:hypothetical protein